MLQAGRERVLNVALLAAIGDRRAGQIEHRVSVDGHAA